jgi:hypothetical protein
MYPMNNKIFELTLDGFENQPLEMIKRFLIEQECYHAIKGTEHRGLIVRGCKTSRFKLVQIGDCCTFRDVCRKLVTHGEIPEGQWLMAFMATYPHTDYFAGAICIADASWYIPFGGSFFPGISGFDGKLFFHSTSADLQINFKKSLRWMVEVKEESHG